MANVEAGEVVVQVLLLHPERIWHILGSQCLELSHSSGKSPYHLSELCPLRSTADLEELLRRNVKRFRGGLVFKAHTLCVSLNSRLERVIKDLEHATDVEGVEVVVEVLLPHPEETLVAFLRLQLFCHLVGEGWVRC